MSISSVATNYYAEPLVIADDDGLATVVNPDMELLKELTENSYAYLVESDSTSGIVFVQVG